MRKFSVLFASLLFVIGLSSTAMALTWNVLEGSFLMENVGGDPAITAGVPGELIEGSYQTKSEILNTFTFFAQPVFTYTSAANLGDTNTPAGTIPGGPEPSVDLGAMTADMTSWFANWNGTDFNQGGIATVADLGSGEYQLTWSSLIAGGPFDGFTGNWNLNLTPIPEPASLLLIGSGLVGLLGIARKRAK